MHTIQIIPCDVSYWQFVLELRNSVREWFASNDVIPTDEHVQFMRQYAPDYYIALVDGKPVGFVGVVNNDIRFAVLPEYQGKGIGTCMLKFIHEKYPAAIGRIKKENVASRKAFEKVGITYTSYN